MSENLLQHHGTSYHSRRVVCITVVPSYDQSQYVVEDHVETKVLRLIEGLGPNCRVSKFQWFIATDEPCGAILQDLSHEGVDNVLTFSMLIATDWKFWCKPRSETDEWEFDGLGAFLQQQLVDPVPLDSSSAECLAVYRITAGVEPETDLFQVVGRSPVLVPLFSWRGWLLACVEVGKICKSRQHQAIPPRKR